MAVQRLWSPARCHTQTYCCVPSRDALARSATPECSVTQPLQSSLAARCGLRIHAMLPKEAKNRFYNCCGAVRQWGQMCAQDSPCRHRVRCGSEPCQHQRGSFRALNCRSRRSHTTKYWGASLNVRLLCAVHLSLQVQRTAALRPPCRWPNTFCSRDVCPNAAGPVSRCAPASRPAGGEMHVQFGSRHVFGAP